MLLLFRFFVSDFQMSFDIFEPKKYDVEFTPDPVLKIYAILVLIVFTIVASILMANLLIAVLTYKFNPGQIDAESGFQRVMMLEDFQAHVDKRLLPAPFSVVVAASRVLMLPGGTRRKLDRKRFGAFLLPPLDDLGEARHCPTGRKELPYLLFLCTMMPALNTLFGALLVLVLPFCVSHFGLQCSHQAARSAARMIASMRLFSPWPQLSLGQPGISFLTASRGAIFFRSHESSGGRRKSSPSARKLFVALLYTLAMALSLPLMVALGGVLYCLLAAGLWLYSAVYVWLASVLYSCFWLLFGVFTGWLGPSSKVTPEPDSAAEKSSRQSSSAGPSNTSGKNKRWGKLLAKRRKEEFKKVAFKQDDIDTALVLAGLPLQKPSTDEKQNAWKRSSSPSNSPKKAPRDSSDCHLERSVSTPPGCRQMKALKSQKERLGASIAQGKARMLELNTSMARVHQAGHGPGGLAQGIARFDSRHHGHQHPPTQFGALNVSMSRQPTGKRSAAHGGHPSYSGPLMEFSGLMNEMGGVRDDLSQIQEVLQILTSDMLWVKQHVMSGASGHGMARVEGSELSVCVEEEDGTEQAGGGSASDTSAAGDPGPDQGFLQGANGDGRDLDGAPSRPSGTQ